MRHFNLLIICCSILISSVNAQIETKHLNATVDSDLLFQKSKKQKVAAWVLLGAGAAIGITGMGIITKDASENAAHETSGLIVTIFTLGLATPEPYEPVHRAAGPILTVAGLGAMLSSIPLFNASAKNKRKANFLIKNEAAFFNPEIILSRQFISMGVTVKL